MDGLLTSENLVALLTLTALEIVLGIDNIVFISILSGKLPKHIRRRARVIGLSLAFVARVGLLLGITWVMRLSADLFTVLGQGLSGKDLILVSGGLFLVAKSTYEIHHKVEYPSETSSPEQGDAAAFGSTVLQIIVIDVVFSLDSVITAVGMAQEVAIMILAVLVAIAVMMAFAGVIGDFIEDHPALKLLALAFLLLIGVMLIAEAFDQKISKGMIYFAMAFALGIELLNMRMWRKSRPAFGGVTGRQCRDHNSVGP
jgi:predicted tellurium resistance membrane protein TerC